jgi:hypothetical protein
MSLLEQIKEAIEHVVRLQTTFVLKRGWTYSYVLAKEEWMWAKQCVNAENGEYVTAPTLERAVEIEMTQDLIDEVLTDGL